MDNPSKRKQIFGADKEVVALVRLVLNSDSSHVLPVKPLCQIVIDYYGHFECHEISCFYGVDAYLSNLQIVRHNGQTFLFTASQRDQLIAISPNSFNYNFGRFGETTCNADPLRSAHTFCVLNSGTILTVAYNDNSRHFITRWFLSINNGEPTIKRENSTGEGWKPYLGFLHQRGTSDGDCNTAEFTGISQLTPPIQLDSQETTFALDNDRIRRIDHKDGLSRVSTIVKTLPTHRLSNYTYFRTSLNGLTHNSTATRFYTVHDDGFVWEISPFSGLKRLYQLPTKPTTLRCTLQLVRDKYLVLLCSGWIYVWDTSDGCGQFLIPPSTAQRYEIASFVARERDTRTIFDSHQVLIRSREATFHISEAGNRLYLADENTIRTIHFSLF